MLHASKQAQIAGRLQRIKAEMGDLQKQLAANAQQQQSGSGDAEIKQLEALKTKIEYIQGMQGFQDLLKRPDLF